MQSLCRCVWLSAVVCCTFLDASSLDVRRGCGGGGGGGGGRSNDDGEAVGWKTLRATIVFEGQAKQRASVPGQPHLSSVEFRVHQVFKGDDRVKRSQRVSVGFFDEGDFETARVSIGSRYLVFVDGPVTNPVDAVSDSTWSNSSTRPPFYRLSSFPEEFSNKAVKEVRSHACRKCARPPRITKSPKIKEEEKMEGQRLTLHCRAAGRPLPCVTWYKDGVELKTEKSLTIRNQRQDSRLQIRNVGALDSGIYRCQATNALGNASSDDVIVTVRQVSSKPHSIPCRGQNYCFNGGKCFKFSQLNKKYCECVRNFTGLRCEEKLAAGSAQVAVGKGEDTFKKKKKRKRGLEGRQLGHHHHQHHAIGA